MSNTAAETVVLETRETRRSFGPVWFVLGFLMLGLPFLGRQQVTVTSQRVTLQSGFWNKIRDDIEIFRIRDIVVKQSIWARMFGIGDVIIKSTEGRAEETHTLKGLADPTSVSETIRGIWVKTARPQGPATNLD